ncbi:MAG: 3-deoxy-D-manno-octulosonic acid transferase [Acidobacteriota bacterium]
MFFIYSLLYTLAFIVLSPLLLLRRDKYAVGLSERFGNYPEFNRNGRPVIWLHCVSVGEANAARPLVDRLLEAFPDHRLIFSTTTRTGQELARRIFKDKAAAVFYFPFDWKFSIRRALKHFQPSVVLMMETEIWPRFFREVHLSGSKLAIVNGRLSETSFQRYSYIKRFVQKVLGFVDLALMQGDGDTERLASLGFDRDRMTTTGNLKFDLAFDESEGAFSENFRSRFGIDGERPLIVAASTHEPEEELILGAFVFLSLAHPAIRPRLIIAPRHPERFEAVAEIIDSSAHKEQNSYDRRFARRSARGSEDDKFANVILLDSIGELRSVLALADVVFVGGSLIRHGGQSVLEPAVAGKAILTGPYTHNFEAVICEFTASNALIQLQEDQLETLEEQLHDRLFDLLTDPDERARLGAAAAGVMTANRGSTEITINELTSLIGD